jgi:hypothetical protein
MDAYSSLDAGLVHSLPIRAITYTEIHHNRHISPVLSKLSTSLPPFPPWYFPSERDTKVVLRAPASEDVPTARLGDVTVDHGYTG